MQSERSALISNARSPPWRRRISPSRGGERDPESRANERSRSEPPPVGVGIPIASGRLSRVETDDSWFDRLMESRGGDAAGRWRRAKAESQAFHEARAARDAELDSLSFDEVRRRTIGALDHAVSLLRTTPLDSELRRHGWSEQFALGLADECAEDCEHVEKGTYRKEWGGGGLGRWMLDEVSLHVGDEDDLHDSIHEAQFMLQALCRRLPG
jgi:hypothetical protein